MSSGADLARTALAAARAAAKARGGTSSGKPKRLATVKRRGGRDPIGLGAALGAIADARGWDLQTKAGSITDRWLEMAPAEFAESVRPEHFDPDRRVLHLRPMTQAAASMLRWTGAQLAARLNAKLGDDIIAAIKVLSVGREAGAPELSIDNRAPSGSDCRAITLRPQPTGAPPSAELQAWRDRYREQRATQAAEPVRPASPYFDGAYGTLREPEELNRDAVAAREAAEEQARRSADSQARALAAARRQRRVGDPVPLHRIVGAA